MVMHLPRALEDLAKGLGYAVALREQETCVRAIARSTCSMLVPYQPVSQYQLKGPSFTECCVNSAYSLLGRCIARQYLQEGRKLALLAATC